MAGLRSGEDRMKIDPVVWAQYINVTATQPHNHVATAIAALTHCVGQQKFASKLSMYMLPPAPTCLRGFVRRVTPWGTFVPEV